MNTLSNKLIPAGTSLMVALLVGLAPMAHAFTDPSSVQIKIYEVRMSHSADCSNSIRVVSNPIGVTTDFVTNPSLGSGAIPNGQYQCVMVKLSNVLTYVPSVNDGANCLGGTTYNRSVFHGGPGQTNSIDPDGNTITPIGVDSSNLTENPFWAYFKIGGGTQDCKSPATACTLTNPVNISGDRTGTLVVDFDGKIDGSNNPCDVQAPVFSFR
jgi:hypothetical protein